MTILKEASMYLEQASWILRTHTGLDVETEHGADTPKRFLSMLSELTSHRECDGQCIKWKTFPRESDEMIVTDNIPFVSVCNHHVLPFIGKASIAYVPKDSIAGLSKFARVVHHYAGMLQVQERLTVDIADFLEDELQPLGVGVILQAEHFCLTIRGAQTPGTLTTTSAMRGVFADHSKTAKAEFLSFMFINGGKK